MAYLIWVDVVWSQQFRYRQYSFLHPLRFHRPILLKRGKCIWNCSGTDACCGEPEPLYSTQFWLPLTCLLVRSFVSCFLDDPKMGRDRGWAMGKMEHGSERSERRWIVTFPFIDWQPTSMLLLLARCSADLSEQWEDTGGTEIGEGDEAKPNLCCAKENSYKLRRQPGVTKRYTLM